MTEAASATSEHTRALSPSAAGRRTIALAVALVVFSAICVSLLDLSAQAGQPICMQWWLIALLAIAAELMVFHVEFRRELYSFTFSEIVLVLGLFLAAPRDLIIGRLVGEALFLVVKERQVARKLILNLASFFGEVAVLLAVYQLLGKPVDMGRPGSWLVALAAVAMADMVGYLVVYQAVHWHGAPITLRSILGIGVLTVPVNTCFALVVGILLVERPWATLLLAGVGVFLLVSYRSYTALRQRYESLSMLYGFTRLVSGAQRPDSVLEAILTQAKDLLRAERAEIWLSNEDGSYLRLRVDDEGQTTSALDDEHAGALHSWLTAVDSAAIVERDSPDPWARELARALDARDAVVAPITESGSIVGLVAVADRLGEIIHFLETDRTMFATLASHASIALENGRLIERLHQEAQNRRHEALHDALTGLPNRVLFGTWLREQLKEVAASESHLAVALMDLDGFKEINDTLGHQCGDVVLGEVARRISHSVGRIAAVARLGGDEFAILFPKMTTRSELAAIAHRIRDDVARPIVADGIQVNVSVSIGLAVAPDDAGDGPTLLQRADVAMYSAKAGHGRGVAFYEALRDENSPRRLALGADLRAAIAAGELSLAFQPKLRLSDGAMVGVEALARWRHPTFGFVPPDEFIPLAERTGVINDLTAAVLRSALAEARCWRDAGHEWTVAVNVAMRNLLDHDFVRVVARLLADSGVDPAALTLEITETGVMSDAARTVDVLKGLAGLGIGLSIDDFGTGYSSLSYLQQLPVSEVKIDRIFVSELMHDPSAETIVRSVIDLAHNLGLAVVAEGVEDRPTWERLRTLGCTMAQGYFMSRPLPPEDLETWFAELPTLQLGDRRGKASPVVPPAAVPPMADDPVTPLMV